MKTIIVYYSHTNNNKVLAGELMKRLDCTALRLEEQKKRTGFTILLDLLLNRLPVLKPYPYSLRDFDLVILLAPVWAGKIATPMRSFIEQEKYNIPRYSFITLCGGAAGQNVKLKHEFTRISGKEPFRVTELWVNDLLPEEKRDTIRYTSTYRVIPPDLAFFESKIEQFVEEHREPVMV
jgi:flavodoxin